MEEKALIKLEIYIEAVRKYARSLQEKNFHPFYQELEREILQAEESRDKALLEKVHASEELIKIRTAFIFDVGRIFARYARRDEMEEE